MEKFKIFALGFVGVLPLIGAMCVLFVGESELFLAMTAGGWLLSLPFYLISAGRNEDLSGFAKAIYIGSFFTLCPSTLSYPIYWLLQVWFPYRERKMMESALED